MRQYIPRQLGARILSRRALLSAFALFLSALAACAAPSGRQVARGPTPAITATPTIAATPAPSATPRPTTTPAPAGPLPILDVRPAAMSLVGRLDCARKSAYICQAAVISRSANHTRLRWTSFTSVPGHIIFSPASGTLAPGQTVIVTITVPLGDCAHGLFYFRGPANTHTISWAC